MTNNEKKYSELIKIPSFEERLKYLKLDGIVADVTFGSHRYLNQQFYSSKEWQDIRREVILRDNGCDLAIEDMPIIRSIYIHHLNPIIIDDILQRKNCVFDLENLICTSFKTHNLIHYGVDTVSVPKVTIERSQNDTCPWKN